MRIFFLVLSIMAFAYGFMIFIGAKSAIHEIEALILFLIGAVFIVGAGIVDSVVFENF